MERLLLIVLPLLLIVGCEEDETPIEVEYGTVTDIEGYEYKTVKIGEQWWMAENLKVKHYRNGDTISTGHSNQEWPNLSTGAYAVYDNNDSNANTYGYLYSWYAVNDSRNIAPEGWHIPTDEEWQTLVEYLGGSSVAGGKLKEEGTDHWQSPNLGATNESGFKALAGGHRYKDGKYYFLNFAGTFASSTVEDSSGSPWTMWIYSGHSKTIRLYLSPFGDYYQELGMSVRCVKD